MPTREELTSMLQEFLSNDANIKQAQLVTKAALEAVVKARAAITAEETARDGAVQGIADGTGDKDTQVGILRGAAGNISSAQ